jgi:hypothetical protein
MAMCTPSNEAVRLNGKTLENVSVTENTGYTTKQRTFTRVKENTSPLFISYKGHASIAIPDIS